METGAFRFQERSQSLEYRTIVWKTRAGGENVSQRDIRRPREADLERELRPAFQEYEEWRSAQAQAGPQAKEPEKAEEKKRPFGKMDIIFIVLGVLAGLVWQSCRAG